MNSNRIVNRAAAGFACLSFVALAASCGPAEEGVLIDAEVASDEPIASDSAAIQGYCPPGWVDPDFVTIDCPRGSEIRARVFGGNLCVQCSGGGGGTLDYCEWPWVRRSQHLSCGYGERLVYLGPCKRCVDVDDENPRRCSWPWVRENQYLRCDDDERVIYRGGCKRCVKHDDRDNRSGECSSNADCIRTGCSGEVCSSEEVFTTCEWRPELECYQRPFARCVCDDGECGWARTPRLRQCLAAARG